MRVLISSENMYKTNIAPNFPAYDKFILIDETYANGDGTDSWCSNHAQLPADMYFNGTYVHPKNGIWSCFKGIMQSKLRVNIETYFDPAKVSPCSNRARPYQYTLYFLCMQ
jgi:hypothetical protein